MLKQEFESRLKVQQVIDSQLPEFILEENPKFTEFLKQYYISQEYQGGVTDLAENLDQYLKLDNLTPEVVVGSTDLSVGISSTDTVIQVSSTKGFPKTYGLLKIDDEIITYTGITTNTFTGCIRGFSGITNYHEELNYEELVFKTSESASHNQSSTVQNLSSLFLTEFYKKIKFALTPGLEKLKLDSNLNIGNFIKEARTLYETKGTEESFRILFNVLFGETPKIINLEDYTIKPSASEYSRRLVAVADVISGDPLQLTGQTLYKNDDSKTTASISEIEVIQRKNKTYYKLLLFLGYDDSFPTITGTFNITGSTQNITSVSVGSSVITVDSTIGFPKSGTVYSGDNIINYTDKTVNQFLNCTGVTSVIESASLIHSDETYYGYENGDQTKKVILRLTGVLSKYEEISSNAPISVGDNLNVRNIGEIIENPINDASYKEIFANSWVYNTSSRYQISDILFSGDTSEFTLKSEVDKSSLKVGDYVDLLYRDSQTIISSNLMIKTIVDKQVTIDTPINLTAGALYDIRRKLNFASSVSVPLEYNNLTTDIQNLYNSKDTDFYIASNSLPSYQINKTIFSYDASGVSGQLNTGLYSIIEFTEKVSFITGSEIYYTSTGDTISGLSEGIYYVEVLTGNKKIKLYPSREVVGTSNYLSFGSLTNDTHNFTLSSQKEKIISSQKLLRKFPLSVNLNDGISELTPTGSIGELVNGVEILNYKSEDKIYYGPLTSVDVLNGGIDFDVINPPELTVSSGTAKIQPVVSGTLKNVYVNPQDFDIDVIVSISFSGGNGTGVSFEPVIEKRRREIEFDARQLTVGGGVDTSLETITFLSNHGLTDGEEITYRPGNNTPLGIGTFTGLNTNTGLSLKNENSYYVKYISDKTIQLYQSLSDYRSGINTVGFTTIGTAGIHKFATQIKNTLTQIKVINGGENFTNRKLRVKSSGISTVTNTINFTNHGFNEGELVIYSNTDTSIVGLSTTNQYYVSKIDENNFRLSNAGVAGTIRSDYERRKYVSLGSTGSGYHIFNYPPITLNVQYSAVGLGSTQYRGIIEATPIVRGKIVSTYVYEGGSDYGSKILNYHKKPSISIKTGKSAQLSPILSNGRIESVSVLYGGVEYYSTPDLVISGVGTGAILLPVITNNKISSVVVINSGYGYDSNTTIQVIPSGQKAVFDVQVRSLDVNQNVIYNDVNDSTTTESNEIILTSNNNLQYYVSGYSKYIQSKFNDTGEFHSPIIGWAYDWHPIYGSYGYSSADNTSEIKQLKSGYTLSTDYIENRPSGFSSGFFIDDYKFTNSGDLDQYNGRFCITPEFPNGVYAYFATSTQNPLKTDDSIGVFPYFIGNRYRSKFISENKSLDQDFDFNNSNLVRNTFPYKVNDEYADNDFIIESNEVVNQSTVIESVTSGSVENFEILNSGDNYKVGDSLVFDESETEGGGLIAQVSEIKGKAITNLNTTIETYNDAIFTWKNGNQIEIIIQPNHNLETLDYVNVSGLSSIASNLNGLYEIGVTSYRSILTKNVPSSGLVTDIYVSSIPVISIGSSIGIGTETLSVLNIFSEQNVLRVLRGISGASHTATSAVNFIPNSVTIHNTIDYFESTNNDLVYFNPRNSVGVGTTSGIGVAVTYNIGIQTNNIISIPTQSIFIPNHPFKTNQAVTFTKISTASSISVANTSSSSPFNLPLSGDSETVYIIKKSPNHIGIVTQIGLTTSTNGLYFISNGSDDYQYSLQSNFTQVKGKVEKISTNISVSTSHNLKNEDLIRLEVKPNQSVGIGTSTSIKIQRDTLTGFILVNQIGFNSTGINTSTSQITLLNHKLKTGDKIKYSADLIASGLSTGYYYVYKVNDNNIQLCDTYQDSIRDNSPNVVSIASTGGSLQKISLVNPQLNVIRNNNLVFDLSDSSLSGYDFKIFYDDTYSDEFTSSGLTNTFSVSGIGTVGVSTNASLTINYDDSIPSKLYYALEKSGVISEVDKDVSNSSQINYVNSSYNGSYKISGVGDTTFKISLRDLPEVNTYIQSECDSLEYFTNSTSGYGGVSKIRTITPGQDFKKLPIFKEITSENGTGAYILPQSNTIGKINEVRIINEGFEYASDKTLKPQATIAKFAVLDDSYTINSIQIDDGGKNYISPPNLIIINSETGEKIDSGLILASVSQTKVDSVKIEVEPKGLPSTPVTIKSINNTNGIQVQNIQSSSSGIVTCFIVTPTFGFSVEPFANNDRIFVEGIRKDSEDGDGFNSEDYDYNFFTVSNYNSSVNPRKFEYNLSGFTTNPGIAKTSLLSYGKIVNYNSYPKFTVTHKFSTFIVGESVEVKILNDYVEQDLKVVESRENYVKVSGRYNLQKSQLIRGKQSGTIATINDIETSFGFFTISYGSEQRIGWLDNTGKLDEDTQVIQDNDYYQNLSYSIKSRQTWNDIVSPVNSIVHPAGLKNFADTEILESTSIGINSTDSSISRYDWIEENRVDTINNFDLVLDYGSLEYNTKLLKFKNRKFSSYIQCKTNRVLEIDDISSEFSSSDLEITPSTKIVDIIKTRKFNRYLIQISSKDYSETQFNEIIIINDDDSIATLEKGTINTGVSTDIGYEANLIGDVYGYMLEDGTCNLTFEPKEGYSTSYNIKYLNTTFNNSTPGIGTTSVGFVDLIGNTLSVSTGQTKTLVSAPTSKLKSIHSQVFVTDSISGDMNYVELFVDHNNVDTNIAEFYFDIDSGSSFGFIGSFGASISSGILSLNYVNNTANTVTVQSRNVGFGTTAIGIGTYRFKLVGQLDDYENSVKYESKYSNVSSASTITSYDTSKFNSVKSTIRVGLGSTSALHQVMMISDSSNTYITQYPFLSVGSASGIGTFGSELVGSVASLKFYPDPTSSGQIEILSFNEVFFKENDYVNTPPELTYHNALESVGVSKYYAVNDSDLNRLNFELNHQGTPIFMKTFNPSDESVLNKDTGTFTIQNHFFSTGEELIYRPNSTFIGVSASSVGIGSTLNYVGVVTDILPQTVYAIKLSNNTFKIATRKEYATSGIGVTFTSSGSGNAHELEMVKKNEKSIISIDNVIQSPIAYSLLSYSVNNGGQIGTASTTFALSGISSIILGDILKIDNEFMKVTNVGLGTTYSGPISFAGTFPLVSVIRGFVGSSATTHSDSSNVSLYRGSYNISKSQLFFTEAPKGTLSDQLLEDLDNLSEGVSKFNGRVFLKNDYSSNVIYDNISERFTGIGQTYTLTVGGANTVGLGTSGGNGIVIINGTYQTPSTENNPNNNFKIIENTIAGISSIVFSGITSTNNSIIISQSDVNMNQLPRGGMIVSLGSTPGLGYAPLVGASVTAVIGAGGSITSIGIGSTGTWGSGYRSPVSIAITETGHSGTAATITAIVGAGGTLSFNIVGGGTGYVNPTINISPPSYNNLPVIGVSRLGIGSTTDCGTGLLVNVEVGASSTTGIGSTLFEVSNFKITRNGYGFKKGDVIKAVGLVTAYGLTQPISEFNLTILETFTDSFSAWQFGELDYIDSIQSLQDGVRKRFPLAYNSSLLSFERDSSNSEIDFNYLLIIFVNGVLQKPGESYQFEGGTSFEFIEAPKSTDNISIYFYRGSSSDSEIKEVVETIKSGDTLQIFSNNGNLNSTVTQNPRVVSGIVTSDTIETNLYTLQGIDEVNQKPISWTKQKVDKVIDGYIVSKARKSIESQIYPTAKVIGSLSSTDTEIFVDNAEFFNYENETPGNIDFDALIVSESSNSVEKIKNVSSVDGFSGNIIGIASTSGIGVDLAIKFTLDAPSYTGIQVGNPIYVYNTKVGNGVISGSFNQVGILTGSLSTDSSDYFGASVAMSSDGSSIVVGAPTNELGSPSDTGLAYVFDDNTIGIGTTFLDNIYEINSFDSATGIMTCNVMSFTNTVGIATTGSMVGKFSWGKLSGFTRESTPITLNTKNLIVNSGLTSHPTVQRRNFETGSNGSIWMI